MILLGKAKSFFQRIRRRSISVSKHKTNHEFPVEGEDGKLSSEPANVSQIGDRPSDTKTADSIDIATSRGFVEEGIFIPEFEVETSAEQYFNDNHGEQARGAFHEVDFIRWDHQETDWSLGETELLPPANPTDKISDPVEINFAKDLWKYALLIMSFRQNGEITTRELIESLPNFVRLKDEHMVTNESRKDSKFSQIVRNLKSHKTSKSNFIYQGYAQDIRGGFKITDKGMEFVSSYFKE